MSLKYCRELRRVVLLVVCLSRCVQPSLEICRGSAGKSDPSAVAITAGSEVTLPCNSSSVDNGVLWRKNGKSIPPCVSHTVDEMGSITINSTALSANGVYSCHNNVSEEQLGRITLEVGYPPEKPTVHCRAINPDKVICRWTSGRETFLPINFTIVVKSNNDKIDCIRKCDKNECSFQGEYTNVFSYVVTVVAKNALGCETSKSEQFSFKTMIKPDPPIIRRVVPAQASERNIWVICSYPNTWRRVNEGFKLKLELEYKSTKERHFRKLDNSEVIVSFGKVWLLKIPYARPGTSYMIRVRAKDCLNYGNWSDWSRLSYANGSNEDERTVDVPKMLTNAAHTSLYIYSSGDSEPTQYPDALHKVYPHGGTTKRSFISILCCSACLAVTILIAVAFVYLKKRRKEDVRQRDAASRQELEPLPAPVVLMNGEVDSTNATNEALSQNHVTRVDSEESNPFIQIFGDSGFAINNNVINSEYFYKIHFSFQETQV